MAKFTLRACPAHFKDEERKLHTFFIGDAPLGTLTIEATSITEIKVRVLAFGATVAAKHPDTSFCVWVYLRDGRKPRGFDAAENAGDLGTDTWMRVIPRLVA